MTGGRPGFSPAAGSCTLRRMSSFEAIRLRTARLELRPHVPGDAAALFAMFSDPEVMRYWSTPPWPSIESAHAFLERAKKAMADEEFLRLALVRAGDGALLGTCTLFSFVHSSRRAEVGYALARGAWGRGYMHEALAALLDHGFGPLGLHRLEADVDPRNRASARALERLGFVKEGHLRERWIVAGEISDSDVYGLLAADWRARRAAGKETPA